MGSKINGNRDGVAAKEWEKIVLDRVYAGPVRSTLANLRYRVGVSRIARKLTEAVAEGHSVLRAEVRLEDIIDTTYIGGHSFAFYPHMGGEWVVFWLGRGPEIGAMTGAMGGLLREIVGLNSGETAYYAVLASAVDYFEQIYGSDQLQYYARAVNGRSMLLDQLLRETSVWTRLAGIIIAMRELAKKGMEI